MKATAKQRGPYVISGGGRGSHWEALDEDISVRGLILGKIDGTRPRSSRTKTAA